VSPAGEAHQRQACEAAEGGGYPFAHGSSPRAPPTCGG
jgi:hypothetical protein